MIFSFATQDGKTALHRAAYRGYMEVINALLQAGADVSLQSKVSWTNFV